MHSEVKMTNDDDVALFSVSVPFVSSKNIADGIGK